MAKKKAAGKRAAGKKSSTPAHRHVVNFPPQMAQAIQRLARQRGKDFNLNEYIRGLIARQLSEEFPELDPSELARMPWGGHRTGRKHSEIKVFEDSPNDRTQPDDKH